MKNAKLAGSNIVDFIPQAGACPLGCPDCYYNLGVSEGAEWIRAANNCPSTQDMAGKIVRINSGHDSNLCRRDSLDAHTLFKHAFFNTSLPRFDFPRPVVFTANPGWMDWQFHEPATHWKWDNLMFVRFLVTDIQDSTRRWLVEKSKPYINNGIFIVLTFMRYREEPEQVITWAYEHVKHFEHEWWTVCSEHRKIFFTDMHDALPDGRLGVCGGRGGDERCAACGICESTYWTWLGKHGLAKWQEQAPRCEGYG